MSGFKDKNINIKFKQIFYERFKQFFLSCCKKMVEDFVSENKPLPNLENDIRNILVMEYFNNIEIKKELKFSDVKVSFEIETPEAYNQLTYQHLGRADIKVSNEDRFALGGEEKYYLIECKRLDGYSVLNKKYVSDGVDRFIGDGVKYPSSYKKNIMFGMIVEAIDIPANTIKINEIQNKNIKKHLLSELINTKDAQPDYCTYEGKYIANNEEITLDHIFYDLSPAINV